MTPLEAVAKERARQIELGWTPEHDDREETTNALLEASLGYLAEARGAPYLVKTMDIYWPWNDRKIHKMYPRRRKLEIAGALIIAALERMDRGGEE